MIPVFTSHYSLGDSIITLKSKGKTEEHNPTSAFDLVAESDEKEIYLVDDRFDGFVEAYKNSKSIGVQLNFGIKFVCCEDHEVKNDDSLATQSKIIIFAKNTDGYHDLIKIYNRAWTENFYYQGRTSWRQISDLWTDNLLLVMPFFSSFLATNTITTKNVIPKFPCDKKDIILLNEVNSNIPFAPLIQDSIKSFSDNKIEIIDTKSIYYKKYSDFEKYITYRCIQNQTKFEVPNINHLSSNSFCWEDYLTLK